MDELIKAVETLMHEEYERAAVKSGERFNSSHEAYAVILEELQEAKKEFKYIKEFVGWYWYNIKENNAESHGNALKALEETAIKAACECIQVAAMAYKARK